MLPSVSVPQSELQDGERPQILEGLLLRGKVKELLGGGGDPAPCE